MLVFRRQSRRRSAKEKGIMLADAIASDADCLAVEGRFALRRERRRGRGGERKAHGIARGSSSSMSVAPLHDPASATFLNRTHCLHFCHSDNDAAPAQLTGTRWRFAARVSMSGPGVAGAFRFESRSIRMQSVVASVAAGLRNDQHEKEAVPDDARGVVAFCRWVGSGWCCVPGLRGPHLKCRVVRVVIV